MISRLLSLHSFHSIFGSLHWVIVYLNIYLWRSYCDAFDHSTTYYQTSMCIYIAVATDRFLVIELALITESLIEITCTVAHRNSVL